MLDGRFVAWRSLCRTVRISPKRNPLGGSVVAIADEDGVVANINKYDEYGAPASGNVGRFQYTGQMWIAEAGLYHYKARVYHPGLGRFMQTDPIGYGDGMCLYAYVGNDPTNATDPAGECLIVGAFLGAASEGLAIWLDRRSGRDVSFLQGTGRVAASAAIGAFTCGLGNLAAKVVTRLGMRAFKAIATKAALNGIIGGSGNVGTAFARAYLMGAPPPEIGALAQDFGWGFFGGALSTLGAEALEGILKSTRDFSPSGSWLGNAAGTTIDAAINNATTVKELMRSYEGNKNTTVQFNINSDGLGRGWNDASNFGGIASLFGFSLAASPSSFGSLTGGVGAGGISDEAIAALLRAN